VLLGLAGAKAYPPVDVRLHNRPMKLARPGGGEKDRDSVLASTPSFERSLEAARPGSLSLVLGRYSNEYILRVDVVSGPP
jgi:hypothetical protein